MTAKIRRDDEVTVLTGKDKGKCDKVKNALSSGKVTIESINLAKRHQRPVPALSQPDGIVEKEAATRISNVAIFNATTGKADRIDFRFEGDKEVRLSRSNNEIIKQFGVVRRRDCMIATKTKQLKNS